MNKRPSCIVIFGGGFLAFCVFGAILATIDRHRSLAEVEPYTPPERRPATVTASLNCFTRKAPAADADVGVVFKAGDTLPMLGRSGEWYQTPNGWVSIEHVAVDYGTAGPPTPAPTPTPSHDGTQAWIMCQDFIDDRLKAPSTAKYPTASRVGIQHHGGGRYSIAGWVDSQNSFGATTRQKLVCDIHHEGGGMWRLDGLSFVQ